MNYTFIIIISIFLLYFIFLYNLYLEHESYIIESKIPLVPLIESFDSNHCPDTTPDDSTANMEINSSQFIQKEKKLNSEALSGFYKHHGGIGWIVRPFLDNYYYNDNPARVPGVLIWCFASWTTWVPKINTCHLTLCIPVIFTNILCDLYTLKYDEVKKHFGYMIYSRDDHSRLKSIYTNSANLRSQVITLYQTTNVCDRWRQETAHLNLANSVNDDIRYFVDRCFNISGDQITNNGRCRIPPNRVVLDYDLYKPPKKKKKKKGFCVIS